MAVFGCCCCCCSVAYKLLSTRRLLSTCCHCCRRCCCCCCCNCAHLGTMDAESVCDLLAGLSGLFGDQDLEVNVDRQEELRVVQTALWKLFEQYSLQSSDRSQAVAASLAAFFKRVGYVDTTGVLDSCLLFNNKDKKVAWLKNAKRVQSTPEDQVIESAKMMLERNVATISNQFVTLPASPIKSTIHDPDLDVECERPPLEASIPKEELKKLKKEEKKRQEVINELFYTERAYMRTLKVMYLTFYQPMLAENWIPRELTMMLFPGIDEVIEAHAAMNNEFKERKLRGAVVQNVGDILLKNFSGANGDLFIAACSIFCRDQTYALNLLRARLRKEPKLVQFLQEAASDPRCRRQELKDLLPQVMSRLAKYPLLIDSLLKHTPCMENSSSAAGSEEYAQLVEARRCVRGILHNVNEAVRERENQRKVLDMRKHVEMRSMDASTDSVLAEFKDLDNKVFREKLLCDGTLTWRLGGGKQVVVRVALFSNVVLLLQPQEDKLVLRCHNVMLGGRDKIPHGPIIKLQNLIVREHAADKEAFSLIVTTKMMPRRYEFVASNTEEKSKWCQLVNEASESVKSLSAMLPTSVASHVLSLVDL